MSKKTLSRFYVLPILLLLSVAPAPDALEPSLAELRLPSCEAAGESAQRFVAHALRLSENRFKIEAKPTFFLGFAVKIDEREQRQISHALMLPDDQLSDGLESVFKAVGERLLVDRAQLQQWVQQHQLTSEVEVRQQPTDGRFLLLNATRMGLRRILCAGVTGDLPAVFTRLGP